MNAKNKLVKFVELKNKIVKKTTNMCYINDEDIEDIKRWNSEECKTTYKKLKNNIFKLEDISGFAVGVCPWCISIPPNGTSLPCAKCGYGLRHGICDSKNSLYFKYRSKYIESMYITLEEPLSNRVYRDMIDQIERSK